MSSTHLSYNTRQIRPNPIPHRLPPKRPLAIIRQQIVRLRERPLPRLVAQRRERVLEHVGSVGGADHGDGAEVAELEILGQELVAREDDGALGEDVTDAAAELLLGAAVGYGVGGHVEEEEVALFGAEDAFVYEAFCEAFADLFELVAYFHEIPGFA